MKRRKFVKFAGMGVVGINLGLLTSCTKELFQDELIEDGLLFGKGRPPIGNSRNLLKRPQPLLVDNITAEPCSCDVGGGNSNVWAFNGSFPGPTIDVRSGDRFTKRFNNNLQDESIVHWHGMLVNHENDGHPIFAVPPGGSYNYDFVVNQRATLNWYHPHPHGKTGEQVNMGLAGAFIIRDDEEDRLSLPKDNYELPLIIRDASFDKNGDIVYNPRSGGFVGKTYLVNGTKEPYIDVDRAVYRLRVLNGANARIFDLSLSNNADFRLIGNDGGLLASEVSISNIVTSPAERLDLLVDFRGIASGTSVMLHDAISGWDLLEFKVGAKTVSNSISTTGSSISSLGIPVRTREFSFDGMSKINGKLYDMNRIDWEVPFGETEEWIFTTNGNAPHPIHIHGAYFQIQERTGGRGQLFPWEEGWKDTVLLHDGETVKIRIKFDTIETKGGTYLMHCHKLEHEDMGMMANFKVVP